MNWAERETGSWWTPILDDTGLQFAIRTEIDGFSLWRHEDALTLQIMPSAPEESDIFASLDAARGAAEQERQPRSPYGPHVAAA